MTEEKPKEVCDASIRFGDDVGDNSCTFRCQLAKGHESSHLAKGDMGYGIIKHPYTLWWQGSNEELNEIQHKKEEKRLEDPAEATREIFGEYWASDMDEVEAANTPVFKDRENFEKVWKFIQEEYINKFKDWPSYVSRIALMLKAKETIEKYFSGTK